MGKMTGIACHSGRQNSDIGVNLYLIKHVKFVREANKQRKVKHNIDIPKNTQDLKL